MTTPFPKPLVSSILFLFLTSFLVQAEIKIAVIDTGRVFLATEEIKNQEETLKADLEKLQEDPRIKAIKAEQERIKKENDELVASSAPLEERKKRAADLQGEIRELQALQKDAGEEIGRQQRELQKRIVEVSALNMKKIQAVIAAYAKQKGYALVLESAGQTNTRLPALLYSKDATDITDDIIALVNKK